MPHIIGRQMYTDEAGKRASIVPGASPVFDPVAQLVALGAAAFRPTTGDIALIIGGRVIIIRGTVTVLDKFRSQAEVDRAGIQLASHAASRCEAYWREYVESAALTDRNAAIEAALVEACEGCAQRDEESEWCSPEYGCGVARIRARLGGSPCTDV